MRVRSALLATAAAARRTAAVPTGTAPAATGFVLYTTQPGNVRYMLYKPTDDTCYNLSGQGYAFNGTDRNIALYAYSDCAGDITEQLPPVTADTKASFMSVKFVR